MSRHSVHCFSLATTSWDTVPSFACDDNEIDIWRIAIERNGAGLETMKALLSPQELLRADRYHRDKDRQRFITSRAGLRWLLGRYLGADPIDIEFTLGQHKKPYLKKPASRLHFNTSHVDNMVLIAIARVEIGIDLEKVDGEFDWQEILDSTFSPDEIAFVRGQPAHAERAFYTLWTRKEALAKATGKGLQDDFTMFPSLDGEHEINGNLYTGNWEIASFEAGESALGALAYPTGITRQRFKELDMGRMNE